jgi:hypothetical protein
VRANVHAPLEISGGVVSLRASKPQRTLYELTSWAEREGVELVDLQANRPGLEDVFLELTADGNHG